MRRIWLTSGLCMGLGACGSPDAAGSNAEGADSGKADEADGDGSAATVCRQTATFPNPVMAQVLADVSGAVDDNGTPVISNYTAWPVYDPRARTAAMDPSVTRTITDPDEALDNLASRFGDCSGAVAEHLRTAKPNIYIYFNGFGGADQNNSLVSGAGFLRWVNQRDPNALIFAINWNCAESDDKFCSANTDALATTDSSPYVVSMMRAIEVIVPTIAPPEAVAQLKQMVGGFGQQQRGYDSALSHSMWLAARLIDQLLVADQGPDGASRIGDIHVAGYSMGAHSAAQLLVQDFSVGSRSAGGSSAKWSVKACADGSDECTVAGLSKLKWSLAMGLSGWSDAIARHNDEGRSAADQAHYQNGGLLRVKHSSYQGKLAVLNRRMDPTGNSDDTFQRGFLDSFFGDYNHYSHDYDLPLFIDTSFLRVLDAFLESDTATSVPEIGILYDNASIVTFDECPGSGSCDARTGYFAHEETRSHSVVDIPRVTVNTVEGVPHPEQSNNRAASFAAGAAKPVVLRTFDQEDLRGGVELYLRPHYDVGGAGSHGVFSYGSCGGSDGELMPRAFVEDGKLHFEMTYEGTPFAVELDAKKAGLAKDTWTHLAFNWELPVESMTVPHSSAQDLAAAVNNMAPDLKTHGIALALATGLTKPLATTYKRQVGAGKLMIYVNGNLAAEAPLGTADSRRECLSAADVLGDQPYDVNGAEYRAFSPYARYDRKTGDAVAISGGTKCKAYRVRNEQAFFGCGGDSGASADSDMDDITLIWGPGRTEFDNIDHKTGKPVIWPIGVNYDDAPFRK